MVINRPSTQIETVLDRSHIQNLAPLMQETCAQFLVEVTNIREKSACKHIVADLK
jgi:hypothetical protein